MRLFSAFYATILPFLFFFTVPIAIFASITTTLAFCILCFRVVIVYIELALAVIPYYLCGPKDDIKVSQSKRAIYNPPTLASRRKKRRSSASSSQSATGSITPVPARILKGSESMLGLGQSVGITRDYEGVGGWRLDDSGSDDDALWTNMNSRLELPANHGRRHHQRSSTSSSLPSEELKIRSPEATMNTSKARTPTSIGLGLGGESYFPTMTPSPKTKKKPSFGSASGSPTSSKASSVVNMKQI
ncbi:ab8a0fce-e4dd-4953-a987-6bbafda54202-CDS [Sclerotinia trifoliorum]|uniref:Ab8a0fce-e4dd-4953-a987-6bbafda54202-CDS n=1 Tax=Sclerotinia trifoliorum TaxID=28548 RepID=A0A8H2VSA3_9HELO|nr:ab8a0fce-e4dd-4953-a987-6bbafda54202-CDS [Sclerotinia trifoliorum]